MGEADETDGGPDAEAVLRRARRPDLYTTFLEADAAPAATPTPAEAAPGAEAVPPRPLGNVAAALAAALTGDEPHDPGVPDDGEPDDGEPDVGGPDVGGPPVEPGEPAAEDEPGPDGGPAPWANPADRHQGRSCDLTLAGGLDVALAAPSAICALAEHYVFRRLAGTSAAAVPAAGAAAAELGRTTSVRTAPRDLAMTSPGFAGLADAIAWLAGDDDPGDDPGDDRSPSGDKGTTGGLRRAGEGEPWRLARLFAPADDATGLHRLLTAAIRPHPGRRPRRGLRTAAAALATVDRGGRRLVGLLWAGAVLGGAGTVVALGRSAQVSRWLLPFVAVPLVATFALAAAGGTALLVAQAVRRAVRAALATDGWGLVSGSPEGSPPQGSPPEAADRGERPSRLDRIAGVLPAGSAPPLFTWVADRLDDLAGVPAAGGQSQRYALTFGDLWLGRLGRRTAADVRLLRRAAVRPALRVVDLVLVTTDVSRGRPYLLPFGTADRPEQALATGYLLCRSCLIGVLPARVADQMVLLSPGAPDRAPTCPRHPDEPLYALPEPWDLPVAFAVRLAASVPGVLRAVPLHRDDDGAGVTTHWFCDGAVTGGLPPDLFDVPLPRWPTFSFGPAPSGGASGGAAGGGSVLVPDQDDAGPVAFWRPVRGVGGLAGALIGAGLGWRSLLQAQSPARRGGTALLGAPLPAGPAAVPAEDPAAGPGPFRTRAQILRLAAAGQAAGTTLRERFTGADDGDAARTRIDRYRWVRLRTALDRWRRESLAMGAQVPLYTDLALGYRVPPDLAAWFDPPLDAGGPDPAWGDALSAVTHLRSLADGGVLDWDTDWGAAPPDAHDRLG